MPTESTRPGARLPQLDGLRTFAFLAVALSHWIPEPSQFGLPLGMGVQLFFVLSGFLITGILWDYRENVMSGRVSVGRALQTFYLRRFLRIFPLFYLTLAVAVLLNLGPIAETWKWHVTYASNFYYYLTGAQDMFRHFWSLAVEEQFYLIWPFIVLLASRRVIPWIFGLMILGAPLFRILAHHPDHRVNYLLLSCCDALGVGALLAYLLRSANGLPSKSMLGLSVVGGVCLLGLLWMKWPQSSWVVNIGHALVVLLFGLVVYAGAQGIRGWVGHILEFKLITFLGQISYGLYVFHNLFTRLDLAPAFKVLNLPESWAISPVVKLFAQFFLTILLATFSWHFFEKRINGLKSRVRLVPDPADDSAEAVAVRA